ncbi:MAG: hypothetical protein NT067_05820 [Candidatus Diapherotrites archaeon]|nr:hypothetical protein [Candidatus Diapherotrites archaeon]
MRIFTKNEFGLMDLGELDTHKERIYEKLRLNREPRKNRNVLYELLGVLEEKIKYEGLMPELKIA